MFVLEWKWKMINKVIFLLQSTVHSTSLLVSFDLVEKSQMPPWLERSDLNVKQTLGQNQEWRRGNLQKRILLKGTKYINYLSYLFPIERVNNCGHKHWMISPSYLAKLLKFLRDIPVYIVIGKMIKYEEMFLQGVIFN